jgi:hypothetical protein
MNELPDEGDVGGKGGNEGKIATRTVQNRGRVEVGEEFIEHIGSEVGDDVLVATVGGVVMILPSDIGLLNASEVIEELKGSDLQV